MDKNDQNVGEKVVNLPEFLRRDLGGLIHLSGHRIGLEDLVHDYNEGYSPESLTCEYPALSLSLIHRVIAFYLDHREEVDRYIARNQLAIERQRASALRGPSVMEMRERLAATVGPRRR